MRNEQRKQVIGGLHYLFTTVRRDDGSCSVTVTHGSRTVTVVRGTNRQVAEMTALARRLTVCDAGDIAALFAARNAHIETCDACASAYECDCAA